MNVKTPKSVSAAIALLWICVALGIVTAIVDQQRLAALAPPLFVNVVMFVSYACVVALILLIAARKNWARIAFAVLFLVGLVPGLSYLWSSLVDVPVSGMLRLASLCLQVAALIFLFRRDSSDWFGSGSRLAEASADASAERGPPMDRAVATALPESAKTAAYVQSDSREPIDLEPGAALPELAKSTAYEQPTNSNPSFWNRYDHLIVAGGLLVALIAIFVVIGFTQPTNLHIATRAAHADRELLEASDADLFSMIRSDEAQSRVDAFKTVEQSMMLHRLSYWKFSDLSTVVPPIQRGAFSELEVAELERHEIWFLEGNERFFVLLLFNPTSQVVNEVVADLELTRFHGHLNVRYGGAYGGANGSVHAGVQAADGGLGQGRA